MPDTFDNTPKPLSNFATNLLDILDVVTYRHVPRGDFSDPIFKLRYDAYRREEFIPFNSLGTCVDDLDALPSAYCFGLYIEKRLVGSLRVHHVTSEHRDCPATKVYPDVMHPMLDAGKTFIDPSRFTADYEASLAYPALPFLTLRLAVMASDYFKTNYCLTTARPEHIAFYRRVFRAVEIGDVRPYPDLNFSIALYSTSVDDTLQTLYQRYPFFRSTAAEREALFGTEPDPANPVYVPTTVRTVLATLDGDG